VRAGRGAGLDEVGACDVVGGVLGGVGVGRGWSARSGVVTGVVDGAGGAELLVVLGAGVVPAGAAAPELQATAANRIAATPPIAATLRRRVTAPRYRPSSDPPV
jgi:hypothetical protein